MPEKVSAGPAVEALRGRNWRTGAPDRADAATAQGVALGRVSPAECPGHALPPVGTVGPLSDPRLFICWVGSVTARKGPGNALMGCWTRACEVCRFAGEDLALCRGRPGCGAAPGPEQEGDGLSSECGAAWGL